MKKYLLFVALILSTTCSIAQEKQQSFQIGLGLEPGISITSGRANILSFGFELQVENHFSKQISGFFSAGLNILFSTDGYLVAGLIPFQAVPRFYFYKGLFTGVGLGYAILIENGERVGSFSYHPHIGIDTKTTQIIFGYDALSGNSYTLGLLDLKFIFKL